MEKLRKLQPSNLLFVLLLQGRKNLQLFQRDQTSIVFTSPRAVQKEWHHKYNDDIFGFSSHKSPCNFSPSLRSDTSEIVLVCIKHVIVVIYLRFINTKTSLWCVETLVLSPFSAVSVKSFSKY